MNILQDNLPVYVRYYIRVQLLWVIDDYVRYVVSKNVAATAISIWDDVSDSVHFYDNAEIDQ